MDTKFIAVVAIAVGFTMPAMAVKCVPPKTVHSGGAACAPKLVSHNPQGVTVSHGGSAVAKKPH
jgi:hypothetical protein